MCCWMHAIISPASQKHRHLQKQAREYDSETPPPPQYSHSPKSNPAPSIGKNQSGLSQEHASPSRWNAAKHSEVESDQLQICFGLLGINMPPLIKKTHVRDIKLGKFLIGVKLLELPSFKTASAVNSVRKCGNGAEKAGFLFLCPLSPAQVFQEAASALRGCTQVGKKATLIAKLSQDAPFYSSNRQKSKRISSPITLRYMVLPDFPGKCYFLHRQHSFSADKTPEEEKPYSFLS